MTDMPDWIQDATRDLAAMSTVAEAAKYLRVCKRTLQREIAHGRLTTVRLSTGNGASRTLVPRAEIARYLVACAERGAGAK